MSITPQNILLIGSVLLFFSVLAGQGSQRIGVPALLLFLAVGILAGSEGLFTLISGVPDSGIHFDNPLLVQYIGIVALCFILWSGGMDTKWKQVRPVLWAGTSLSILGTIVTALATGVFVWLVSDFTLVEGLLLGSVTASTDAAAVFSILRSRSLSLRHNLRPLLEFESGSNDPIAFLLTILFIEIWKSPGVGFAPFLLQFLTDMIIGAGVGFVMGWISVKVINRIKTQYIGLFTVAVISFVFFTYSFTELIGGNGFLAVYIAGIFFGNHKIVHKENIESSFDGFAWLMQVVLFVVLGLQVYPSQEWQVLGIGFAVSLFMIIVARPLSVFICLAFSKFDIKSKLFVSWVGLRGAAPIVFATYPMVAGVEKASAIFHIVFFIAFTSMLIQGTSIPIVGKWLKVALKLPKHITRKALDNKTEMVEIELLENNPWIGKRLIDTDFPEGVRISMIRRSGEYLVPDGNTVLAKGDHLFLLCKQSDEIKQFNDTVIMAH
ncbi:MAG: potassium/proton antiporter [Bacteroidales bacterium]|jgi:cell volume regulation protein A|nr:potassium/proton antiporter [Bacteroidales bacterium]